MSISSTTAKLGERRARVSTRDGVALAIRESGPQHAAVTVVFLHGHCLSTESWTFVTEALAAQYPAAKIVSYDHRGHGESQEAAAATYTITQLGHDLHDVLAAVAPTGPVVLVGHSMGGMTAITYAGLYAHEIGTRIVGIALIATAANGLAEAGYGRLLQNPIVSWFQAAVRKSPAAMRRAKLAACKVFAPVVRSAEFGNRKVSPRVLALANAMHNATSIVTMATFLSSFMTYDETATMPSLSAIPTLVLCGTADLMTPPSHSVAMAAQVEYSDLVMVDGAGHSVILEQPAQVADALVRMLTRASGPDCAGAARLALVA
ncbi:alpha/beta fold hydrolase [Antrihabitans sp. YC2-6]|uniref:alpha/beta fold hydrolase n=1 Tax=Antrihabitans sp. YC2-6 TaxID=2799498 RepID=UPI0018F5A7AE|nr:alpha/beta hydrolase [Antrihabitans sp. YC2-6]MBJ8345954.1 alpha/beta hydrolase [Antrihabitans sp. YC2-6]